MTLIDTRPLFPRSRIIPPSPASLLSPTLHRPTYSALVIGLGDVLRPFRARRLRSLLQHERKLYQRFHFLFLHVTTNVFRRLRGASRPDTRRIQGASRTSMKRHLG